jgi:hypothetical protein
MTNNPRDTLEHRKHSPRYVVVKKIEDCPDGGFIFVDGNGYIQKMRADGHVRNNWRTEFRERSKKYLKHNCEVCGIPDTLAKLTIHHIIPLRLKLDISEKNCMTVCRYCHDSIENPNRKVRR